ERLCVALRVQLEASRDRFQTAQLLPDLVLVRSSLPTLLVKDEEGYPKRHEDSAERKEEVQVLNEDADDHEDQSEDEGRHGRHRQSLRSLSRLPGRGAAAHRALIGHAT